LVILIDDAGFGSSSAFGGPCQTPNAEALAAGGLKFNRFHTTALCSPTRQALLTGRNHHSVGMGGITEIATGAPGYNSILPNTCAPLARTLKLNGYATAQFGKCHEVPVWETSPAGPFDAWPTGGGGFEYFYGFIGGEAHQWYPSLYEGTTPIEVKKTPEEGYHFMEDMTDKAINWIGQQQALMADKPFFVYFAPGATHAPHHVPAEWADKYKGKFNQGWDKLREETFARQLKLGVIPKDCKLTPRHKEIPAWDEMPAALKPVLIRQMEVYAGFLEYADHHVGRLLDSLKHLKLLDNTVVYYIVGDNGASAEGTLHGTYNEMINFNGAAALETPEFLMERLGKLGGPESYNHYAVGWAHAMNTPYQWTKQVASHFGGTRNGTIVHWPKGIKGKGEIRSQFHHVIDVAPTILELAGLPQPLSVNGVQQRPIEGVSMAYAFNDAAAADRHETQYFEMFGNRGIYHKGWTAVTRHKTPWLLIGEKVPAFDDDNWELYDTSKDWSQANNLAQKMPERLHELQRLWLIEAVRYNVLPLDDDLGQLRYGRPPGPDQRQLAGPLRQHGTPVRKLRSQPEEQVACRDCQHRRSRQRCGRRDHRSRWQHRRLESLCQGRQAQILLQPTRYQAVLCRIGHRAHTWRTSGAHGVCLRRRWSRQRWHRVSVCRWQESWRRQDRCHCRDDLLCRRWLRCGHGHGISRFPGLRLARQRVLWPRQRGSTGHGRGGRKPRSLGVSRGRSPYRDGAAVNLSH
jgi:arylsulfatase